MNEAASEVLRKGQNRLGTIGLGLIRPEVATERADMGKRDELGWAYKPPGGVDAWQEFRSKKKAKRDAKKRRRKAIREAIQNVASLTAKPPLSFYQSWEWAKLRFEVLKAYGAVCMLCHSTENIVVDHIKPRRKFPALELDFDNMQVLCDRCNRGKSNDDYTDFRPKLAAPELAEPEMAHLKDIMGVH